jgi:GTP pyrophosphokinase
VGRAAGAGEPDPYVAAGPLLAAHAARFRRADVASLRRAYGVAERCHRGQFRKSGAPYVTHPLAVAMMLAELGLDTTTLIAALLHDTVEDTDLTLSQVRAEFGDEVAVLVDGVTKLDGAKWGDRAEAETFRKMILVAADDLRVLVIKLADRVHNLRTLRFHPKREKRERIARASQELLVPLADRLGIYVIKREMEDLAFATLNPRDYERTRTAMAATADVRAAQLGPLMARLRATLAEAKLRTEVLTRDRHLFSLHRDRLDPMADDPTLRAGDATRVTVLVDGTDADCYVALGVVHGLWRPLPGRMKDHVALPKYNMYRSLHTTVLTPEGDILEVVIRTPRMHEVAEYGIIAQISEAARTTGRTSREAASRPDLQWLRNLLAWQSHAPSSEFLDSVRVDLRGGGMVTFTPGGRPVPLPRGATAIDFAYAVDPDLGHHAIGAVINDRLVPLAAALGDGQVVQILTDSDPDSGPSETWLRATRTGHARVHIQRRLTERRVEQAARTGRDMVAGALSAEGADLLELEADGTVLDACVHLGHHTLEDLYAAIAAGSITLPDLTTRLLPSTDRTPAVPPDPGPGA